MLENLKVQLSAISRAHSLHDKKARYEKKEARLTENLTEKE